VPREDLMAEAQRYAENIAANAPLAVQASKELAVRSRDVDTATGLRLEQMVARTLRQTEDAQEGRLAFIEKRQPKFTGQ
jgi:E-phenylitaconyl-CoA hydratase